MKKEFDPKKKKIDENPVAVLLHFLKMQRMLVEDPPVDMTLDEIVDTKVLCKAIGDFVDQFNAACYEIKVLRETLKLYDQTQKKPNLTI